MNSENTRTLNTESTLENLTLTLLYEGYALYPYHRSAIKNQKPIPFGVVFPEIYNACNVHAHSMMQTQCLISGSEDLLVQISIRFLHLKKIELLKCIPWKTRNEMGFVPVNNLTVNDKFYEACWQTLERNLSTEYLNISSLLKNPKVIPIDFDETSDSKYIYDENGLVAAKQTSTLKEINGMIIIKAAHEENIQNSFRITISITNTTSVINAETITRDEVLSQSFLSTHTILKTTNAEFISHQNPGEKWKHAIEACQNINTWPILIDEDNSTLLSSPIILYDYPQINPKSPGDMFDGTEIEEALQLHISVLSDDEKKRISQSDEKLQAMLNKMSHVTPEEFIGFHSGLKYTTQDQIDDDKK